MSSKSKKYFDNFSKQLLLDFCEFINEKKDKEIVNIKNVEEYLGMKIEKEVKSPVKSVDSNICVAIKADGSQCTKKKDNKGSDKDLCGIHNRHNPKKRARVEKEDPEVKKSREKLEKIKKESPKRVSTLKKTKINDPESESESEEENKGCEYIPKKGVKKGKVCGKTKSEKSEKYCSQHIPKEKVIESSDDSGDELTIEKLTPIQIEGRDYFLDPDGKTLWVKEKNQTSEYGYLEETSSGTKAVKVEFEESDDESEFKKEEQLEC